MSLGTGTLLCSKTKLWVSAGVGDGGLFVSSSAQKQICALLRWGDGGGAECGWRGGEAGRQCIQ